MVFPFVLLLAASVTHPFVGVTHTEDAARGLHVVQVDLDAPGLRFQLTRPGGPRETVRQTTLDFCRELAAQVCVNAHFFEPFPTADIDSFLIGLAAAEGVRYSEFEEPGQAYALVKNAAALHISATNEAEIVGPSYGGPLWTALAGSAQIVTGGAVTIPRYAPEGVLRPGVYSNAKSWYDVVTARTVIGLSANRKVLTVATMRRTTVGALAELLVRDFAVHDALNLDGGGSTTLVMENAATRAAEVVNEPSGGKPRAVASSLAIFARRP